MGRLKGIPAILQPDLLHALASMGHGDEIGEFLQDLTLSQRQLRMLCHLLGYGAVQSFILVTCCMSFHIRTIRRHIAQDWQL
jgi:L-fucose mutarotase/ribose pyranase (RbsD/FucU family)